METFEQKIIDEYLKVYKKSLPNTLYHYTSIDGLIGIIKSKNIWASEIQYLNDKEEFIRTIKLLRRKTLEKFKGQSDDSIKKGFIAMFDRSKILDEIDIYVISLTEKGDLLSQWRGYCPNYGFSLGFDYNKLKNLTENKSEKFFLLPCFYNKKDHEYFINLIFRETANSLLNTNITDEQRDSIDEYFRQIYDEHTEKVVKISSIFKDNSFSEEIEWRLFCIRKRNKYHYLEYRNGNSMIIPYIKFAIENKYKATPIKEIIVGPTPHQDLSVKSVEKLLNSYKVTSKVIKSEIPFRNW